MVRFYWGPGGREVGEGCYKEIGRSTNAAFGCFLFIHMVERTVTPHPRLHPHLKVKEAPRECFQRSWTLAAMETYIFLSERILTELLKLFSLFKAAHREEVKSSLGKALYIQVGGSA